MLNNLKKTVVAALALSSSAVFAGTMGPVCTPGNITVPSVKSAWGVGVQALYLDTTFTNGNSTFGNNGPIFGPGFGRGFQDSWSSRWGWGFGLEGSFQFNTGNELNINWSHRNNEANNFNVGAPRWDVVNIEVAQPVNLLRNDQFLRAPDLRFNPVAPVTHTPELRFNPDVAQVAEIDLLPPNRGVDQVVLTPERRIHHGEIPVARIPVLGRNRAPVAVATPALGGNRVSLARILLALGGNRVSLARVLRFRQITSNSTFFSRFRVGLQVARIADRGPNRGAAAALEPLFFIAPAAIAPVPVAFEPELAEPIPPSPSTSPMPDPALPFEPGLIGVFPTGIPGFIGPVFAPAGSLVNPAFLGFAANGFANSTEARFNGIGPRFGADLNYIVGDGFSVYANGATTLLVGSSRPAFRFDPAVAVNRAFIPFFPVAVTVDPMGVVTPVNPFVNPFGFSGLGAGAFGNENRRNKTTLVPQLEGKLGAKYTYTMPQGDLTFDVGYLWVNYFNARHTITSRGTFVDGFGFRHHLGFDVNESSIGFNGPCAGIKWVGNLI